MALTGQMTSQAPQYVQASALMKATLPSIKPIAWGRQAGKQSPQPVQLSRSICGNQIVSRICLYSFFILLRL
jgi:hypothetical protein